MKALVGAAVLAGIVLAGGCGGDQPPAADGRAPFQNLAPASGASASDHAAATATPEQPKTAVAELPRAGKSSVELDQVVAMIGKEPLTLRAFIAPLIEAHGLPMLLNLARLELVKQDAASSKPKVIVSEQDFAEERQTTLDKMFADSKPEQVLKEQLERAIQHKDNAAADRLRAEIASQRDEFLDQFLEKQHISRVEFGIVVQLNTYLRKIAEPQIEKRITPEDLRSAFNQLYGEKAHVHYIELPNLEEVNKAKRRLAAGDAFDDVARDMSLNRDSARIGGDMPAFTRAQADLPEGFKDVAFTLQPGQVSDPVAVGPSFLLLKMIERIPPDPKVVRFEDQREAVRAILSDKLLTASVRQLRESLDQQLLQVLKVHDPVMKKQLQAMIDRQVHDRQKMNQDMERNRLLNGAGPTTAPATRPVMQSEPAISIPAPTLPDAETQPTAATAPAAAPTTAPPATAPSAEHPPA